MSCRAKQAEAEMQNVPKIVRDRLKVAMPAVNHPDADMLTAFAERSLPEVERGIVLGHLARCGDCRDIVALSLPEAEAVEAAASLARRPWITWPAVRWAFVAAGIVAVVSVGLLRYQSHDLAQMSQRQAVSLQTADTEAKNQTTSVPKESVPAAKEEARNENIKTPSSPSTRDSAKAPSPTENDSRVLARSEPTLKKVPQSSYGAGGRTVGGPLNTGPKMPDQWQQRQNSYAFQANAAPAPPSASANAKQQAEVALSSNYAPAAQSVEVSGAAPAINTPEQALDAKVQSQPMAPPQADSDAVGKAKAPVNVGAQTAAPLNTIVSTTPQQMAAAQSAGMAGRSASQFDATSSSSVFRWTVTPDGGLERSVDRGNTWQGVNVNDSAPSHQATAGLAAKSSRAKEKDDKNQPAASPVFRAVAAMGAEVWAGGSSGALYHSSDGGNHWTRVIPSYAGSALTGDVVKVEFADPQHGKVTTSTGEIWISADAGQTWQKQ